MSHQPAETLPERLRAIAEHLGDWEEADGDSWALGQLATQLERAPHSQQICAACAEIITQQEVTSDE